MIPDAVDAERALLGAVLVQPELLDSVSHLLVSSDWCLECHQRAWSVLTGLDHARERLDAIQLASAVPGLKPHTVTEWMNEWGGGNPTRYVEAILAAKARRDLLRVSERLAQAATSEGLDPFEARDSAVLALGDVDTPQETADGLSTLGDFMARKHESDDWILPGLIGEQWRALIVASEGMGKMWLMRQLAIAGAAGLHPLSFDRIEPIRTLMVDLENPELSVRQSTTRMLAQAHKGGDWDDDRCWLWHQPAGIDIRSRQGRSMLDSALRQAKPHLVCLGPLYKLYRGGKDDLETAAHDVQQILDGFRARYGFALVIEHHAPKSQNGHRDILPFGSSLWLRWPELGIRLMPAEPEGSLLIERWRPDRLPTAWPDRIDRSGGWPWVGVWKNGYKVDMQRLTTEA